MISYTDSFFNFIAFSSRYTYSARKPECLDEEYLPSSALKLIQPPDGCTWREYFGQRSLQDKHIRFLLNEIMSTQKNRKLSPNDTPLSHLEYINT